MKVCWWKATKIRWRANSRDAVVVEGLELWTFFLDGYRVVEQMCTIGMNEIFTWACIAVRCAE